MIDKPLYGNPLAGGGGTLDSLSERTPGLTFRPEGDMRRYVADNDPGGIAAGYSNLKDYLAAGNKLPEFANREPLKAFENPALANSVVGNGIYDMNTSGMLSPGAPGTSTLNVTPPSTPVSEQTPLPGIIDDPFKPKSDDPLMQGYYDSDFYSNQMTMDMVPYTFQGKEMMGSSSGASNLKKYLESIGKGDLLQFKNNDLMSQDLLGKVNPNDPSQQLLDGTRSVNPIVSGPEGIASTATAPMDPFNRVGQQLTGPNQDDILGTLKNIEQGIASLGQGSMDQSSFGGFNNNFGIGSFFPPYGGMYG